MTQRLLVIDDSCDLGSVKREDLANFTDLLMLCWVAPDTLNRLVGADGPTYFDLLQIVGGHRRWEEEAAALAKTICNEGPAHHGHPWREFLVEPLFAEARTVQAILDTFRLCRQRVHAAWQFEIHLWIRTESEQIFRALAAGSDLESMIQSPAPTHRPKRTRASLPQRLARRLRQARVTGNWRAQVRNLATQADPDFGHRIRASRLLSTPDITSNGVTFFSSYLNNSRTLKTVEPYFPQGATWIVTNSPARKGAQSRNSLIHDLWRFAPKTLPAWVKSAYHQDTSRVADFASLGTSRQRAVRTWLHQSPTWHYWHDAGLTTLLRLTACWEAYLEQASPKLVAIANHWGIEGWLARIAKQRGTAVVELMHGVLGGPFYTEGPLAADALIVWGDFWRQQRPESQHSRIHVFNPGPIADQEHSKAPSERLRVTYLSWPFDRSPFYNAGELQDGFIDLFHEILEEHNCQLTIRGHPLENLSDLTRRWQQRFGELPQHLQLSQNEPLSSVLEQTDIAIMFRSTVLLDCLARDIPVLIPGWIDFDWNHSLQQISGIRLVTDFPDLKRQLKAWLKSPPALDRRQTRHFLRPAGEGERAFRTLLAELSEARPTPTPSSPAEDFEDSTSWACER